MLKRGKKIKYCFAVLLRYICAGCQMLIPSLNSKLIILACRDKNKVRSYLFKYLVFFNKLIFKVLLHFSLSQESIKEKPVHSPEESLYKHAYLLRI